MTVLLWVAIAAAAFGQRVVSPGGLPFADWGLAGFVGLAGVASLRTRGVRGTVSLLASIHGSRWLAAFIGAALVSGLVAWASGPDWFSAGHFWRSAAKLILCAATWLFFVALCRPRRAEAERAALVLFALAAGVAASLWGAVEAGVPVPRRLVCTAEAEPCTSEYREGRWLAIGDGVRYRDVVHRAQGLSDEPARLGFVLGSGLTVLLLAPGAVRPPGPLHAVLLLGLLLSFSLTGWAIAGVAIVGWGAFRFRALPRASRASALWLLLPLVFVAVVPPARRAAATTIGGRLLAAAVGAPDGSTSTRIGGTTRTTAAATRGNRWTGAGLGNPDRAMAGEPVPKLFAYARIPTGGIWNWLLYVLAATGVLGLATFLAFLFRTVPTVAALAILAGSFGDGAFLSAWVWVPLALHASLREKPAELSSG